MARFSSVAKRDLLAISGDFYFSTNYSTERNGKEARENSCFFATLANLECLPQAVPQRQGETPTLWFNATATTIATARGMEKRVQRRGMKFDAWKREQGTRPSERNRSVERCERSKISERLEIQYRLDIHCDRRWCRIRKIGEGGERDDNDSMMMERKDVRRSDIRFGSKRERSILMSVILITNFSLNR